MEKKEGKNSNLHQAKKEKNDEFYTQLVDIEQELKNYKDHFEGKIVFCNCDDPYESNFFKFFVLNFKRFGLKKLVAMGYATSPISWSQLPLLEIDGYEEVANKAYKIEVNGVCDKDENGAFDLEDVKALIRENKENITISPLKWNGEYSGGDFRSNASIKILKEADIVVTNPPFSLFREYVAQLIEYGKQFLILWNINAVTYKEIFPLIKDNKMWPWIAFNKTMEFVMNDDYELKGKGFIDSDWKKHGFVPAIARYTNLEHKKRHEPLILYKHYSADEYPKYDNYDAINVNKVAEIPCDYEGVMGVPITFLDKYNPEQFEILGTSDNWIIDDKYKTTPWLTKEFVDDYYKTWLTGSYKKGNPTAWYYQSWIAKMSYKRLFICKR